jgi:hypothetical protein
VAHPAIIAAVNAGLIESCVVLDGNGLELHGYRPTEFGRRYFGPEIVTDRLSEGAITSSPLQGWSTATALTTTKRNPDHDQHHRLSDPRGAPARAPR